MTTKALERGNEIVKELEKLESRIEEYENVIKNTEEDIEHGEEVERIYHCNFAFDCPTKTYLHFIIKLKTDAQGAIAKLGAEFQKL